MPELRWQSIKKAALTSYLSEQTPRSYIDFILFIHVLLKIKIASLRILFAYTFTARDVHRFGGGASLEDHAFVFDLNVLLTVEPGLTT